MKGLTIALLLSTPPAFAAPPAWVTELYPRQNGNELQVVCHGDGPDRSTAFLAALDECRSMASQTVLQNFEVKSLTIQTERDNALHEEIRSQSKVTGLKCEVKNSYEELNQRWLLCAFNTDAVQVIDMNEKSYNSQALEEKPTLQDPDGTYIILAISPRCDSIVVDSTVPRIIPCGKNPLSITVHPGDKDIIVRLKGHQPSHITPQQWQNQRVLSVFLDRT